MSYLIARWFRLPEAYWAPMSTLIVMQSTLSAALPISVQYVAGTAVGAAVGAVTDIYFPGSVWAFGGAVFIIGSFCVVLGVERSTYRYASITLAIVMLVPRSTSARLVALHRFFEVSIGIAVGLAFFASGRESIWAFPPRQIMTEVQMNRPAQRTSSVALQNPELRIVRETIHVKGRLSEQQVTIGVCFMLSLHS